MIFLQRIKMSIRVQQVSKLFGQQKAVQQLSFQINPGEIVGFLGPNGAGKSTTLKMITGYLPPTEGEIWVNGLSIRQHPQRIRQLIGYLPEHNPLYLDLYVHEYLMLAGGFYGMRGRVLADRVKEMIAACGLTREQNKKIEALSKGYRQRVGLAQALMHDPPVLILDEPTSGLDPNQIMDIRTLIRTVSQDKTVIFSTHIMQEVEALCQRVLIIHQGNLVADQLLADLLHDRKGHRWITLDFRETVQAAFLEVLPFVREVKQLSDHRIAVRADYHPDLPAPLFEFAASHGLTLLRVEQEENSLESVFRILTQNGRP